MEPTYNDRKRDLERRLVAALRPADPIEEALIDWLTNSLSPLGSLDVFAEMVERRVKISVAMAYERGRAEGIEQAAEWQGSGLDPEMWPEQPGDHPTGEQS